MVLWRLDMRGAKPLFSNNYRYMLEKYAYCKRHLAPCSLRRMTRKEILKGVYGK